MPKALAFLLLLAACGASPAPEFFRAKRAQITISGRPYTVFHTAKRAEVIRTGPARLRDHPAIRADMLRAVEAVTGCTAPADAFTGDAGEMRGTLRCPKSRAP